MDLESFSRTEWEFFLVDLDKVRETGDMMASNLYHHPASMNDEERLFKCGSLVSALEFSRTWFSSETVEINLARGRCVAMKTGSLVLFIVANLTKPEPPVSKRANLRRLFGDQTSLHRGEINDYASEQARLFFSRPEESGSTTEGEASVVVQVRNDVEVVIDLFHGGLARWNREAESYRAFVQQVGMFFNQYLWVHSMVKNSLGKSIAEASSSWKEDPVLCARCQELMDDVGFMNEAVVGGVLMVAAAGAQLSSSLVDEVHLDDALWSPFFIHPPQMPLDLSRWIACAVNREPMDGGSGAGHRRFAPCQLHTIEGAKRSVQPLADTSLLALYRGKLAWETLSQLKLEKDWAAQTAKSPAKELRWHLLPRDFGRPPSDIGPSDPCYSLLTMNLGRTQMSLILRSCANLVTDAQIRFIFFTSVARLGTIDNHYYRWEEHVDDAAIDSKPCISKRGRRNIAF